LHKGSGATGYWLLATGYWLLAAGCWLLAAGYWLLATGCWLLAAGYWLLAAGCWLLAAGHHVARGHAGWPKRHRRGFQKQNGPPEYQAARDEAMTAPGW